MDDDKAMLFYHLVKKHEGWETSAGMIIDMINSSGQKFPGKPRILVLDIEGHRNSEGGFDHEMWVLQHDVVQKMLSGYFTEVQMPLCHYRVNPETRRSDDDLPLALERDGDMLMLKGPDVP